MFNSSISSIISEEAKNLPDELLKEVLDFMLFLKTKSNISIKTELSSLQQKGLAHLENEFKDYKTLYPHE